MTLFKKINSKCMQLWHGNELQPHQTMNTVESEYAMYRGAAVTLNDFVLLVDGLGSQESITE